MEFVAPYPNVVPESKIIDNFVTLFTDEEFVGGALAYFSEGEQYETYRLVSESAVYSEGIPTPALLIKEVVADGLKDDGHSVTGVFRFSIFQVLSAVATSLESSDALMREAYRRNRAVEAMLKAKAARAVIFDGVNVGGRAKVLVTKREPGETYGGQAAYRRLPSVTVAINFMEGM